MKPLPKHLPDDRKFCQSEYFKIVGERGEQAALAAERRFYKQQRLHNERLIANEAVARNKQACLVAAMDRIRALKPDDCLSELDFPGLTRTEARNCIHRACRLGLGNLHAVDDPNGDGRVKIIQRTK